MGKVTQKGLKFTNFTKMASTFPHYGNIVNELLTATEGFFFDYLLTVAKY